ncbi:MAG TPA: hypothetical protein VLX92_25710 [Kofleriaceae bacterium]|nr:hypothetical protein [Kofleriaceae bacterium]
MSSSPGEPRFYRLTLALVAIAFVAIVAYWGVWFFGDRQALASLDTPAYYTFEDSFPAADGWLALACAACAFALWRRRPSAMLWLIVGGSAAIYLGLMDVLFDVENGVYLAPRGDWGAVGTEIGINAFSLFVGAWVVIYGWVHRAWFLGRAPGARGPGG